jgi:hypothetical protein
MASDLIEQYFLPTVRSNSYRLDLLDLFREHLNYQWMKI